LWEKHNVPSRSLSGGMKRRLMIARALIHEPKLLVLDEPTAGVDIELRRSMWSFLEDINRQGTTIILTTHYLEEAERLCRNIAIIDKGKIVKNTSIKNLIKQLNKETFILDLNREIKDIKPLEGYPLTLIDSTTIEVAVDKDKSLNQLFNHLTDMDIEIISMRNKANRLEELFIDMVEKNLKSDEASSNG
jgi:ABC-2 type transport system ATP-binding protein